MRNPSWIEKIGEKIPRGSEKNRSGSSVCGLLTAMAQLALKIRRAFQEDPDADETMVQPVSDLGVSKKPATAGALGKYLKLVSQRSNLSIVQVHNLASRIQATWRGHSRRSLASLR